MAIMYHNNGLHYQIFHIPPTLSTKPFGNIDTGCMDITGVHSNSPGYNESGESKRESKREEIKKTTQTLKCGFFFLTLHCVSFL